jgi:hypothetical protein
MPRFPAAILAGLGLLAGVSDRASAQRQPGPDQPEQILVTIDAKVGGKKYKGSGNGECKHAPDASIRGVSASLWMVRYAAAKDGSLKQLSLTLWRPKDGGPDQLSLSLETGSGSHRIETGTEGKSAGSGSVTVLPSGPGGRLEIAGKEAGGKAMQVTIDCSAFAGVEAEGG